MSFVSRLDEWSTTYVTPPPITVTTTSPLTIVVTETAAQSTDTSTSTRTNIVETTVTQVVDTVVIETIKAAAITTQSPTYTVPTRAGFTPIASHPKNAGANTFEPSSTAVTPTNTVAEKSYSNINRIVCVTSTIPTYTSTRYWPVRHSTSTVTDVPSVEITASTLSLTSTSTELPEPPLEIVYEDASQTVTTTEIQTSTASKTTTITPTIELPRPTVYAACAANNIVGGFQGSGIHPSYVPSAPDINRHEAYDTFDMPTYQSCCEACIKDERYGCIGSVWSQGRCYLFEPDNERCGTTKLEVSGLAKGLTYRSFGGLVVSNGHCGQLVWDGAVVN